MKRQRKNGLKADFSIILSLLTYYIYERFKENKERVGAELIRRKNVRRSIKAAY